MIDLHTHILPGIDDGSKSVEMSRQMLHSSAQQGVTTVVATPHFYPMHNTPERFLTQRAAAVERLGELPAGSPQLILGAEVAYFDGIGHSEELISLQIGDTGLILIEMPFGNWSSRMITELEELRGNLGLTPVLAHIDRYQGSNQFKQFIRELEEQEILFQCNTDAFLHWLGRGQMLKLIEQDRLHFLGSDAHNMSNRSPNMALAVDVIAKKLGVKTMKRFLDNSKNLLGL